VPLEVCGAALAGIGAAMGVETVLEAVASAAAARAMVEEVREALRAREAKGRVAARAREGVVMVVEVLMAEAVMAARKVADVAALVSAVAEEGREAARDRAAMGGQVVPRWLAAEARVMVAAARAVGTQCRRRRHRVATLEEGAVGGSSARRARR